MASDRELPPPSTFSVFHDHKPVLYLPDGRALVRPAGFRSGMALQTTGQFPQLTIPKIKKGGKKGGKRGC